MRSADKGVRFRRHSHAIWSPHGPSTRSHQPNNPQLIRAMVPKWLQTNSPTDATSHATPALIAPPTPSLTNPARSNTPRRPDPRNRSLVRPSVDHPVRDLAPHAESMPGIAVCTMALIFSSMARSTHRKRPEQLTLDAVRYHSGRGGPRHGAGRPRGIRPRVMHRQRERIVARVPVHVTIRLRRGIPSLAPAPVRAKVPFFLERGLRPARLPGRALLDPTRSRASARSRRTATIRSPAG